ncbi:hypothetical protein FGB62_22g915 [Gracilaria domingensis]|nr:hypothetical protein FGB62_22g915 [Gracilaria domingensis]
MDSTRIGKLQAQSSSPPRRSLIQTKTKEAAKEVVRKLLANETKNYELVNCRKMSSVRKMRSEYYNNYAVLCQINTQKYACWIFCSYLLTGQCPLHSSVKKLDPEQGTSVLKNHTKLHKNSKLTAPEAVVKITERQKKAIINAAAFAVAKDMLPLSFASQNSGMTKFVESVVDACRFVPITARIDIQDMLPSKNAVKEGIQRIAKEYRKNYRVSESENVLALGGSVTSDGLKNDVNGNKYYDCTVHYYKLGSAHLITKAREFQLM